MDGSPTLAAVFPSGLSRATAREHSRQVRAALEAGKVSDGTTWRVAPTPFLLSSSSLAAIEALGTHLLRFTRTLNHLYYLSLRGLQPAWVAAYLDQGKPAELLSYARMHRFRDALPGVIRPDLILTEDGFMISELDAVPGGIGLTGCMARAYADLDWPVVGGDNGMVNGFAQMMQGLQGDRAGSWAVVVSEESKDYRPEMAWLAARLRDAGLPTETVTPRDVSFTEEGLSLPGSIPVSVLYRFFELFDLKNIPKIELLLYAAKKDRVALTPPIKPWLEEKLAFALLHHPVLEPFWSRELGTDTFELLCRWMPRTWILDPRPIPPSAVIPGLEMEGHAVSDWHAVARLGQKERRYVVKPSGFSELAWGSRGVSVGHDLSQQDWAEALEKALASFERVPYILQEFRKGRRLDWHYHDPLTDEIVPLAVRVRLSPYYFVTGETATLAGILATACPLDKKLIHGMSEAIMAPCAVQSEGEG